MLRRLLLALFAGLLAASPAAALSLAVKQVLGPPGWVLPYNPTTQFDLARGAAWNGTGTGGGAVVPPESLLLVSRASTCIIDDLAGRWRTFPASTLCRSDKGATAWEARTNLALWCRDLTNAAWAKVTMTAALTATGIDGTANAATTITATGALSTILQTVVQASTADTVSFFVRRRTGTGTIEVTADGVAFTDITAALATAATATPGGWYRPVVSATLVNPVLGLRIATSGDAVDVDFAQLEAGTFATSPILTTTVSATRASDIPVSAFAPTALLVTGAMFVESTPTTPITTAVDQTLAHYSLGAVGTNRFFLRRALTTGAAVAIAIENSNTNTITTATVLAQNATHKMIAGVGNATLYTAVNGSALQTTALTAAFATALDRFRIGNANGAQFLNGYMSKAAAWATALPPVDQWANLTR